VKERTARQVAYLFAEAMNLRRAIEIVEYRARLDLREPPSRVDLENAVKVLRGVENDRRVARLSRE
jgi:hypothetical protein